MHIRSIADVPNLSGQRCIVRVDYNVPMKGTKVLDDFRIRQSLHTIKHILRSGGSVVLVSHLGRPEGKRKPALSLRPVVKVLKVLMPKTPVSFVTESVTLKLVNKVKKSRSRVIVLENIRFDKREELNDRSLAHLLSQMGQVFVNDAFSVCHRSGASITGVAQFLPSYGGVQLMQEVTALSKVIKPATPAVAIIGGLKADSKFGVIKNLSSKFTVLTGGGIANLFFHARGFDIGGSAYDRAFVRQAKRLNTKKVQLPVDCIITDVDKKVVRHLSIKRSKHLAVSNEMLVDIGPETTKKYATIIRSAKTIVWAGPLGLIEDPRFSHGSLALGKLVAARASGKAYVVVGGGETNEVLKRTHMLKYIDFVSTAGGAMLEFLEGKKLPGLHALAT